MGGPAVSIVVCAYDSPMQFSNMLETLVGQDTDAQYEIIVVDNCSPTPGIYNACRTHSGCVNPKVRYVWVPEWAKNSTGPCQGLDIGIRYARSDRLMVMACSEVLVSRGVVSIVDRELDDSTFICSHKVDWKFSPAGTKRSEYGGDSREDCDRVCAEILEELGWPCDPGEMDTKNPHFRYPGAHSRNSDAYMFGVCRQHWPGYPRNAVSWGQYHQNMMSNMMKREDLRTYRFENENVKFIHQYHRVWKDVSAPGEPWSPVPDLAPSSIVGHVEVKL